MERKIVTNMEIEKHMFSHKSYGMKKQKIVRIWINPNFGWLHIKDIYIQFVEI